MRHSVSIVLGALSGAFVVTATPPLGPPAAHAQTNWREVRSLKMGRFRTRIDVSSARTVRLISQLDTSRLTGPELGADSVRAWQALVFSELDKPTRGSTSSATRYSSSRTPPTARPSGSCSPSPTPMVSRAHCHDRLNGMEEFLDLLARGRGCREPHLTEAELQRLGPVARRSRSRWRSTSPGSSAHRG